MNPAETPTHFEGLTKAERIDIETQAQMHAHHKIMSELKHSLRSSGEGDKCSFELDVAHRYIGIFAAAFGGLITHIGAKNFLSFKMFDHVNGVPLQVIINRTDGESMLDMYGKSCNLLDEAYDLIERYNDAIAGRRKATELLYPDTERFAAKAKGFVEGRRKIMAKGESKAAVLQGNSKKRWTFWRRLAVWVRYIFTGGF